MNSNEKICRKDLMEDIIALGRFDKDSIDLKISSLEELTNHSTLNPKRELDKSKPYQRLMRKIDKKRRREERKRKVDESLSPSQPITKVTKIVS
ncbi:hypothetical protein SNEBB_008718 [Seison nebaliae]|nr:hypothetical protein SNEBB_008718 [Seison nebaliae]